MLEYLRKHYAAVCRHWFDDIEPLNLDHGTLTLLVREQVQLKYLQRCCVSQFNEAAGAATDMLVTVRFIGEAEATEVEIDPEATRRSGKHPAASTQPPALDEMILSPDYSFDNFVIGPGNELACAAARAIASKPGKAYNPFYIHGGIGLGKTHLLQAICQEALRIRKNITLYYTSCNGFMTQFHEAVEAGEMANFRHRFRGVDILVIDDIHDLAKRDRTQEEFFHTFNALYQQGKQIILSADASPGENSNFEERLTSRFNSGLVARLERPCYETRVAIVRKKAQLRNLDLPEDIAAYIAAKIDTNIRELEGAITKVRGVSEVMNEPITLELAKRAIGDHVTGGNGAHPSIQAILDAITRYYDIKLTDLLSKRRHKSIAQPRQVGMYLARKHTRYSLEEIGGYFGGRDHTTVMHAIRAIEGKRGDDVSLDHDVARLEEQLISSTRPAEQQSSANTGAVATV